MLKLIEKANSPKNKVWKPEIGEGYYYINFNYNKMIRHLTWKNDSYDKIFYEMGDCFKTEEEAKFALGKQKVITELKKFALENNDELDWNDFTSDKYCLYYNHRLGKIDVAYDQYAKTATIYFSSEYIAKQAIKTIGEDRLKKYYFEVDDNE